jgi:PTS system nitrogen regulatory IIA component
MDMAELIKPDQVLYLRGSSKMQILQELVRRASKATGMPVQILLDALAAREALGSTGIGEGIAVPHAKIAGLGRFFALFARLEKPINFDAIDGEPVDLVFLLLIPATADKDHLAALACVARRLREPDIASRLRVNTEPAALYEILSATPASAKPG